MNETENVQLTGLEWLDVVDPDIYSGIKGEEIWAIGWILKRKADGRVETKFLYIQQ